MNKHDWNFTQVWNQSLLQREERERLPRNHLWASELGKAPIDLYLRLKGEEPTNPPNARSLRKFEAGNIWEWIVQLILVRSGILLESQEYVKFQYPGLLEVTGKLDFIAGGKPDYEKAERELEQLMLPDVFMRAGTAIVRHLKAHYPDGLGEKVLEIKSTSAFMFEVYDKQKDASDNHKMQNFHYLKGKGVKRGSVVYVCRDDCRMLEVPVLNPSPIEDQYKSAIEELTIALQSDVMPALEKPIVFEKSRFSKNWKVAYSEYLTKIYNFESQAHFDDTYQSKVGSWNRVLTRIKNEQKMTEKNLAILEEIKEAGFDLNEIKKEIKK